MNLFCNRSLLLAALLVLIVQQVVCGQADVGLRVNSNVPAATVIIDSAIVGTVADGPFFLEPGTYEVRLVKGSEAAWDARYPRASIQLAAGDAIIDVELNFSYQRRIETIPFGAEIYVYRAGGRDRIGDSPVMVALDSPEEAHFRAEKSGYEPKVFSIPADSSLFFSHAVSLEARYNLDGSTPRISYLPERSSSRWIDWASAGVAVAAGVAAVHYKFKADRLYETYEMSGNPALRSEIRQYDIYSGIALGVMQVGVGVLAIRLILR